MNENLNVTTEPKKTITLFFGGGVNLGRNMNVLSKSLKPFVGINEMAAADLRLVDLECVIATTGEQRLMKNHACFRARPEQTNILVNANIDIVLTANDHSSDYGSEALLEQKEYLDAAGILHAGSGENFETAFKPVYKRVGNIIVAIFSVDTKIASSAATADGAGTAYLPPDNLELWKETFAERIRVAHETAHVVIVAPHWGTNLVNKTSDTMKKIGHLLIDLGADAVLGCHSHTVHGVENYKNRPIIYDASDLILDAGKRRPAGCFTLKISSDGVEHVKFIPLVVRPGQALRAKKSAPLIIKDFVTMCKEFNTATTTSGTTVDIKFTPPPCESEVVKYFVDFAPAKRLIKPLAEPRSEWVVDKVPDEAIIPPKRLGALKLVGYYVPPACRRMTARKLLTVETYWTIDAPVKENYILSIMGKPTRECRMPSYGKGQEHDFLDFMHSITNWEVGVIYRKKIGLVPPEIKRMANVDLRVEITVTLDDKVVGKFKDPDLIELNIPGLRYPHYDTKFDDIIYQSEPGKCWTAEQLAKVTGGEWIVPPPEGWYIQSFSRTFDKNMLRPSLLLLHNKAAFEKNAKNMEEFAGAMLSGELKNLPADFPLLKVANVGFAMRELGFAARKRFQGKVIAVTGSAGKTTTCNMLSHVFGKDHRIKATPGSSNVYDNIPRIFANLNQNDAYAIIEMSINALAKSPGSITYDITPNVAVVTSIVAAHTGSGGSLESLATHKRKIFCGMAPGGYAILNRDMPYYELFEEKAKATKLNIINFGTHPDAMIRMPVIVNDGEFSALGKTYKLSCSIPAEQLYDALAVVGVSIAVGFSVEKTLEYLQTFTPVKGRGNVIKSTRHGKNLTVINSAYNANPTSMKYALAHLKTSEPNQKSRVAILGDIADLGAKSVEYHKQLAEAMIDAETDRLLLCGKFMRHPYEVVKYKLNVIYFETLNKLLTEVENYLQDGDTILIKSSHDTGLSKVVDLLSKSN